MMRWSQLSGLKSGSGFGGSPAIRYTSADRAEFLQAEFLKEFGIGWNESAKYRVLLDSNEQVLLTMMIECGFDQRYCAKSLERTQGAISYCLRRTIKRLHYIMSPPALPTPGHLEVDHKIVDALQRGITKTIDIAKDTGYSQPYISMRLAVLLPDFGKHLSYYSYKMHPRVKRQGKGRPKRNVAI